MQQGCHQQQPQRHQCQDHRQQDSVVQPQELGNVDQHRNCAGTCRLTNTVLMTSKLFTA